jgi:Bacterial PH domain
MPKWGRPIVARERTTFRSWSANLVGALLLLAVGLTSLCIAGFAPDPTVAERWVTAGVGVACLLFFVRVLAMRVVADDDGIASYGLFRTKRIAWGQISEIVCEDVDYKLVAPIRAPVLYLAALASDRDVAAQRGIVVLRALSSYNLSRSAAPKTKADTATTGLEALRRRALPS